VSVRRPSRVRGRHPATIALLALGLLGLFAPAASALTFEVDNTGDTSGGACTGAASDCSLRSAIELSNSTPNEPDLIGFLPATFNGEPGDKITLTTALPALTSTFLLNGSSCLPAGADIGPCVEVAAPSNAVSVLTLENADNSSINGLSLTGGRFGIDVLDESSALTVTNNWIGVKLDASGGGNADAGIFIDPDSDGAVIGGTGLGGRNVISNNGVGVDVMGADNTSIQGNYIGVKPDGATKAENGKDIEITDSTAAPGFDATGNVVGGPLTSPQAESAACDGACNVISGAASHGIDLQGDGALQEEAPARGATTIQGNLIGLNAAGTGVVQNFRAGIRVGEADTVQIGGATAQVANRINGGEAGIQAGPSSDDLKIEGNRIGLVNAETIAGNRIAMAGGSAIELKGSGTIATTIADNIIGRGVGGETLTAGTVGIQVTQGSGSTIEGNVVDRAHLIGIVLQSSNNRLTGNEVLGTEEDSGIVIEEFGPQPSNGNIVGGDTATEENVISGSGSNSIEIVDGSDTDNQILRNTGSDNSGLFIDLGRDGPGNQPNGPNGGIQPPAITSATPTTVSGGGALAGAAIRVFRKATAQNGEIESFLGEIEADGSGNWSLTYESPLPLGTEVGATQTGSEGTSELAQATTANPPPPPPPPPPAGGGGAGGEEKSPKKEKHKGKAKGKGRDRTPPQTRITKGPPGRTHKRTAKFRFVSSEAGSTFQCRIDRRRFRTCRSPKRYRRLKPGKHVFRVRAIDPAGNVDPTPAVRRFRVLR
jgi:parallel beta-helix repeat protein